MNTFRFVFAVLMVLALSYRTTKMFNRVAEKKVLALKGHSLYRVLFELAKKWVSIFISNLLIVVTIYLVATLALNVFLYILSIGSYEK